MHLILGVHYAIMSVLWANSCSWIHGTQEDLSIYGRWFQKLQKTGQNTVNSILTSNESIEVTKVSNRIESLVSIPEMFRRFLDSILSTSEDSNQTSFVPDDDLDNCPMRPEKEVEDGTIGGLGVSSFGALLGSAGDKYLQKDQFATDSRAVPPSFRSPQNRKKLTRTTKMDDGGYVQNTKPQETSPLKSNDFCMIEEGPIYLLQMAAKGKILELDRRTANDRTELLVRDRNGRGLLHYAVKSAHVPTLDFILTHGIDINAKDYDGNTALHIAVETSQKISLNFLLAHDANPMILNHRLMAPIHLAVDLNRTEILQELLNYDAVDPNLVGENGATPLHYTAWKDHPECARILLKNKAKICATCDIGLTAMHIAAQNSASATLEVLIESAEQKGCGARHELLAKMNQEKNTPLHAAISGGNLQIVRMCLKAGAQIDAKQENGSTPVHMASAQGSLDIIKVMLEMQPEKKMICLFAKDTSGLTPLHLAAMLDRTSTVEYLIQQGAEIDSRSLDGQTPLLLASSKKAWSSAILLLNSEADITVRDPDNRNILHLIIRGGGQPTQFETCICRRTETALAELLNEQDQYGCTPLHYASKQGLLTTIDKLLQLGAHLNAKNNKKQSVLHFAARYGRYNTCRRLIDSGFGATIVNEADGCGQTALHAAASNGHVEVVRLLLQSGAGIFKDVNGNNALHLAAMNSYKHTMAEILNVHSHLLDSVNKNKDTCLHLATIAGHANVVTLLLDMGAKILLNREHLHLLDLGIKHGKKDVCIAIVSHDRWKEALDMRSTLYGCPMVGMIQYMPEVCQMILDRCRIPSGPDPKDKDFYYTYDFKYMQMDVDLRRKLLKNGIEILPMYALNVMVKYNRVDCLSHPVCSGFLAMKWASYGMWFHVANMLVYFIYMICLTAFIVTYDFCHTHETIVTPSNSTTLNSTTNLTTVESHTHATEEHHHCHPQPFLRHEQKFLVFVVLGFVVLNVIKEVVQMIQQKWKYVKDPNNRIEWILYISSALFIGPFLVNSSEKYQWQFGALAVYLAWFNYLLFFQRFNSTGIYIVMFLEILNTLMHVLTVFYVLFIAFGLAFFVLLNTGPNSAGFSSPLLSVVSTIVMILGNIDYLEVWVHPLNESELPNSVMAFFLLVGFILIMPILLINLLIGLAVGDIEAIQKNARLKRIAMQVQLHTELEQKLPSRLLKLVDRSSIKVYPNRQMSAWNMIKNRVLLGERQPCEIFKELGIIEVDAATEYNSFVYNELNQQRLRLKQIRHDMKKHYELLRLIVQKMEIHTEADDVEEDAPAAPAPTPSGPDGTTGIGWSSAALRHVVMKQALIISKWKKSETD